MAKIENEKASSGAPTLSAPYRVARLRVDWALKTGVLIPKIVLR